jgi:hypothetical protein
VQVDGVLDDRAPLVVVVDCLDWADLLSGLVEVAELDNEVSCSPQSMSTEPWPAVSRRDAGNACKHAQTPNSVGFWHFQHV